MLQLNKVRVFFFKDDLEYLLKMKDLITYHINNMNSIYECCSIITANKDGWYFTITIYQKFSLN